jgi:hypothetical protein
MTTSPPYQPQHLLDHLHAWRQYLEQTVGPATPSPAALWGMPAAPPVAPFVPAPAVAPSSPDYVQQLLGHLQAWRQYLEHMAGAAAPRQTLPVTPPSAAEVGWCQAGAPPTAGPPPPGPPPPPPGPPPPGPPPPPADLQSDPDTWTPASEKLEPVMPRHGDYSSQFSQVHAPNHVAHEPISEIVSRYPASFTYFTSGPLIERQWSSAYEVPSSTPAPSAANPPASLHSDPAAANASVTGQRTHRGHEGHAASGAMPERLELIEPTRNVGR